MTPTARSALGAILALIAALGVGAAARAPWIAAPADRALLRLSWRVQSEAREECRPLTAEEKAELPVHMQVPEVCETRAVPYVLEIRIDGSDARVDTLHGTGAREDRPIYIFREIALPPGRHAINVEFVPITVAEAPRFDDEDREDDGHRDEDEEGEGDEEDGDEEDDEDELTGLTLKYSETLVFGPREVALVTYDPERGTLVRVVGR